MTDAQRYGHLQFVKAAEWGCEWLGDARYYGRRWCAHIGPWLVFIWQCSQSEMDAYHDEISQR